MITASAVDLNKNNINDTENSSDSESTTSSKNSDSDLSYEQKRETNIKKIYNGLQILVLSVRKNVLRHHQTEE